MTCNNTMGWNCVRSIETHINNNIIGTHYKSYPNFSHKYPTT
jgi:hypothetical protein